MNELNDEVLMSAYVAGDQAAFRVLFRRHAPTLLARFRRSLREDAAARDLVQQTFLNLHRARFEYRPGSPVRPWLVTIARNLLRDHVTRGFRKNEVCVESEALERLDVREPGRMEDRHAATVAMQELDRPQRELIRKVWLEGRSFEELGAEVGRTALAMRLRAHRAMKRLRELTHRLGDLHAT